MATNQTKLDMQNLSEVMICMRHNMQYLLNEIVIAYMYSTYVYTRVKHYYYI